MKTKIGYTIDTTLKKKYDMCIKDKYGHKRNRCGSELEKAMKVYLTLEGDDLYQDDPDVIDLLGRVESLHGTHTHGNDRVVDVIEERVNEIVEDKFEVLEEKLDRIERKVKGDSNKRVGSLSEFKRQFQAEYGDHSQVSKRDIVRFVTNNYDVHDSRSIKNRIDFLIAQDVLEPFAHNVYNIKF